MEMDRLLILTDEQLVKMAQEGSETAEEILIEKYKGFVRVKAKAYYIVGADSEDVVQEGMIGIFKAIRSYDETKGASFKGFADTCVNGQILSAIKKANRKKNQPLNESVSLNREVEEGEQELTFEDLVQAPLEGNPEDMMLMREIVEHLKTKESGIFSAMEWKVWNERLKGKDYNQIAEILGKSPKSIDNALQRIKKKVITYLEK